MEYSVLSKCVQCEAKYIRKSSPGRNQLYCSRKCYFNSQRGKIRKRLGKIKVCLSCKKSFYCYASDIKRGKLSCSRVCASKNRIGKKWSKERRSKTIGYWKGKHLPIETRQKIGRTRIDRGYIVPTGEKSPAWKGGITPINKRIRRRKQYLEWRREVFERDNYTCVLCGDRNMKGRGQTVILQADHIKPFAFFPELRFEINNGRTLCVPCHRLTDTFGRRAYKYEETKAGRIDR